MKWPWKLVEVEWVDSYSEGATVWTKADDLSLGGYRHISVGYVQDEDAAWLSLVPHVAVEGAVVKTVSGHLAIPKVAIKKRRVLRGR